MNKNFQHMYTYLKTHSGFFIISSIYLLTFILMLPLRNVSFNDDFAYIQTVERLIKTGKLKISDWTAAAIIFQTYWGAIFAQIFGYSIKILHLSNITLLYFALISFFAILRRLNLSETRATIFTLLLLGFPWVFQFTYTFMSDVFYMSLLIISLYFYVKAIQENSRLNYFLGSLFAGLAFLNRQIGIILPTSIFLTLIYQSITSKKILFDKFIYATAPAAVAIFLYSYWQNLVGMTAYQYYTLGPSARQGLLRSFWPIYLAGHTSITNNFYIQTLQRSIGYLNQIGGFLFPIIFIFTVKPQSFIKVFSSNKKYIFVTCILLLITLKIDNLYGSKFTPTLPDILYQDSLIGWSRLWKPFYLLSLIPFVLIAAVTIKQVSHLLLIKKTNPSLKVFKMLTSFYIIWALFHFLNIFGSSIHTRLYIAGAFANWDLQPIILYFTNPNNLSTATIIFQETWFFFLVILGSSISLTYIFTRYRLKFSQKTNMPLLFLSLAFFFETAVMIIPAYYYWSNYVIQIIPFILLWIAYITRSMKISILHSITVVFILLLFSFGITRNSYQLQGAMWEVGTKLVESGINVTNMSVVNWAWRPYWLFESSFEEAVKKASGDKYKVAKIGQWTNLDATEGAYFDIGTTSPDSLQLPDKKPIFKSDVFWTFKGVFQAFVIEHKK